MIIVAGLIIIWVACGLFTTGATVAYFGRKYKEVHSLEDYREDLAFGVGLSIFGPISALIVFCLSGFLAYGWSLRNPGGAE